MVFKAVRTSTKVTLISLAVALLLVAGGVVWLYVELNRALQPNPPDTALPMLVRNLPRQTVKIRPAFQRRVHAQYPDGMAASALANDLRQKGFSIHKDTKTGLEIASLEQQSFPCSSTWIIYWTPNVQGRAQKIGAHVNLGCL